MTKTDVQYPAPTMIMNIGDNAVMYLDRTGSGNETAEHLKIDPRLTIMLYAQEGCR